MTDTQKPKLSANEVFARARSMRIPLGERLRMLSDELFERSPEGARAIDRFAERLAGAKAGNDAPALGEPFPPFLLPDESSRLVSLEAMLEQGPAVIAFHRGHWCPYCRMTMFSLAEIQDEVAPAGIVAISPEVTAYTKKIKAESGARFPFLSDMDAGYAMSLGLAVFVDPDLQQLMTKAGTLIPEFQGGLDWVLPLPAVFVVGQDGLVRARRIDTDYRQRMEPGDILAALRAI